MRIGKIKLNYTIKIMSDKSFSKIKKEVIEFVSEKEKELIESGMKDEFQIVVNVTMPLKSISIT